MSDEITTFMQVIFANGDQSIRMFQSSRTARAWIRILKDDGYTFSWRQFDLTRPLRLDGKLSLVQDLSDTIMAMFQDTTISNIRVRHDNYAKLTLHDSHIGNA